MNMFTIRCLIDDKTLDASVFIAEHGVAFAIETPTGRILFDTGQSGNGLVHNAAQFSLDLHQMDALALSHAHYDHTGGLGIFLQYSRPGLPLYAHPDLFRERYAIKNGQTKSISMRMSHDELSKHMIMNLSAEPSQILPGVWTTGEITPRAEFEGRSPHHYIQTDNVMLPDPYRDDMALILEAKSGLILLCGCCHAGLLNTLAHVRSVFDKEIAAIVGGAHLANVDAETLEYTITILRATSTREIPYLYLNHCTGERALVAFSQAFGQKIRSCPAGTVLMFM
jgi:7,8-dihydropterin-6-yl-methyl-4-(beta-D-ribofuranosyl)aminobenzene 5'-phosphate synthase